MKEKANEFYGRNHLKYDLTSSTDIFKLADDYAQYRIENSEKSEEESLNKFMVYYKNYVPIGTIDSAKQIVTAYLTRDNKPDNKVEPCKHEPELFNGGENQPNYYGCSKCDIVLTENEL